MVCDIELYNDVGSVIFLAVVAVAVAAAVVFVAVVVVVAHSIGAFIWRIYSAHSFGAFIRRIHSAHSLVVVVVGFVVVVGVVCVVVGSGGGGGGDGGDGGGNGDGPLTHLFAPHCSLRSRAPLRSFASSLAYLLVRLLTHALPSSWEGFFFYEMNASIS